MTDDKNELIVTCYVNDDGQTTLKCPNCDMRKRIEDIILDEYEKIKSKNLTEAKIKTSGAEESESDTGADADTDADTGPDSE